MITICFLYPNRLFKSSIMYHLPTTGGISQACAKLRPEYLTKPDKGPVLASKDDALAFTTPPLKNVMVSQ
jgi:hypothetical protein